mmetsp:Transcript_107856/g.300740  ORF Transcript_107856/g.300740 Transcript_107856/m.300740 type:complete len:506 (-) Transcript_107856:105-1622(-)
MSLHITSTLLLSAARTVLAYQEHATASLAVGPEIEEEISQAALSISATLAQPADDRHPFWVFEWDQLYGWQVPECAAMLVLAGLLCSAGGIGGGGIYVSVLMVAGQLSPRDAVPLSKAIVFFGSLSSLALNVGRTLTGTSGTSRTIIDYNICRLVVPAALIGTLFGVVINRNAPDMAIVLMLCSVLVGMTAMVLWTTYTQYCEEERQLRATAAGVAAERSAAGDAERAAEDAKGTGARTEAAPGASGDAEAALQGAGPAEDKEKLRKDCGPQPVDRYLGAGMLAVVVVSGVVRHHASACLWELQQGSSAARRDAACRHPMLTFLVGNRLEGLMGDPSGAGWAMLLTLAVPITVCLVVMAFSSRACVVNDSWSPLEVAKYELMGVLTGCLAGLVGIGGGLIFSPFFLCMGVEPAIAVATSSTCVIFTSSSTTLQYLFTDRIITSLTVAYGFVNLLASYWGTVFVHFLQDQFAARRSYITGIVAVGVLISAILALTKLSSNPSAMHL